MNTSGEAGGLRANTDRAQPNDPTGLVAKRRAGGQDARPGPQAQQEAERCGRGRAETKPQSVARDGLGDGDVEDYLLSDFEEEQLPACRPGECETCGQWDSELREGMCEWCRQQYGVTGES